MHGFSKPPESEFLRLESGNPSIFKNSPSDSVEANLRNLNPWAMPFLQNVLSDVFQKAQWGRLTVGSSIVKRVNPFSSLRPWFSHTLQGEPISARWALLFEYVCFIPVHRSPSAAAAQFVVWPLLPPCSLYLCLGFLLLYPPTPLFVFPFLMSKELDFPLVYF